MASMALQPNRILDTKMVNPQPGFIINDQDQIKQFLHDGQDSNNTFGLDDPPARQWTQVLDPQNDLENPVVAVSGNAVLGSETGQISDEDFPFTHPFGNDYEFYIVPDYQYVSLLAKMNLKPVGATKAQDYKDAQIDDQYAAAMMKADSWYSAPGIVGVLGYEIDAPFVPEDSPTNSVDYRVQDGDRVAIFGRWILDTAHSDFHTEIHPSLFLAAARSSGYDSTTSTLIGRPYTVGQDFGDGGTFRGHLANEIEKLVAPFFATGLPIPGNSQIEFHPTIHTDLPNNVSINYTLRPPSNRYDSGDRLFVDYGFVARSGVSIRLIPTLDDGINLSINIDSSYKAPLAPKTTSKDYSLDELNKLYSNLGDIIGTASKASVSAAAAGALPTLGAEVAVVGAVLNNGIKTDQCDAPQPPALGNLSTVAADQILQPGAPFVTTIDDNQPFPVCGQIVVRWVRASLEEVDVMIDNIQDHVLGSPDELMLLQTFVKVKIGDNYEAQLFGGQQGGQDFPKHLNETVIQVEIWRRVSRKALHGKVEEIDGQYYVVFGKEKYPLPDGFENWPLATQAQFTTIFVQPPVAPGLVRTITFVFNWLNQQITGDLTGNAGQQLQIMSIPGTQWPTPDVWLAVSSKDL